MERGAKPYNTLLFKLHELFHQQYIPTVVQALLKAGADPNFISGFNSPLIYWIKSCKYRFGILVIEALLKGGADPNMRPTYMNYSPLACAITCILNRNGIRKKVIKLLIKYGANVDNHSIECAIGTITNYSCNLGIVDLLRKKGAAGNPSAAHEACVGAKIDNKCIHFFFTQFSHHGQPPAIILIKKLQYVLKYGDCEQFTVLLSIKKHIEKFQLSETTIQTYHFLVKYVATRLRIILLSALVKNSADYCLISILCRDVINEIVYQYILGNLIDPGRKK